MPKHQAIGIQQKPVVDTEELDRLAKLEEEEAAKIARLAEEDDGEEEDDENKDPSKIAKKEVETPKKPEIDWQEKAKESQKEALILREQLKKVEEEKSKKIEITEDYLTKKYPDWNDLTTGEQTAIKKAEVLEQEVAELRNNSNKFNNDREWNEKVESYASEELQDNFPSLVGREEEFKRFATRPTRKGLPMDDLAKIFLFENPKSPEPKRSLFHTPNNGVKPAPKEDGMSPEEARILRTTRPTEYMRLVRLGKIKIKI